jgi:2-C-methyl-D-erythritol 4-phosphate cytidylyltransferase
MKQPASAAAQPSFCYALVPCAGVGSRAGSAQDKPFQPKQFHDIEGQAMVMHTLQALEGVARIHKGWVVESPGNGFDWPSAPAWPARYERMACGGASRAHSVFNGLQALRTQGVQDHDWVLVHDAARCLVTPAMVDALIDRCESDAVGGLLALPVPDTLKAAADGRVLATVDRADKWLAQTPQMFRLGALLAAMAPHEAAGFTGITDEASAMEMAGHAPLLVPGSAHNFKVTYPPDFALAAALLRSRPTSLLRSRTVA